MKKESSIILVTGATGRQGGAVARQLGRLGWRVRAAVRDPQKSAARALAKLGAEVVKADLDDRASIERALQGASGVFSIQNFWETGATREIAQGKMLADAAKAAGVGHFVYSSVGAADRHTGLPHFESKWEIEQHIHRISLPTTILRPVFFMENFDAPNFRTAILQGTLSLALQPNKTLQMIAVEDIGAFAALAFEQPEQFLGQTLELAGDEKTMPQAAEVFSRVLGRPVRFVEQSIEQLRSFNEEMAKMFDWFNKEGYAANISHLRSLHPSLLTLEAWLRKSGWVAAGAGA